MKRKVRRVLSYLLSTVMFAVFCLGNAGITGLAATGDKIDVWDFGAVEESDTSLYTNHITASDWDNCSNVDTSGKFIAGTTSFGDLTITHNANDRLFSTSTKNYGTNGLATTAYADGYTANGMYYCNGTGGDSRRYITIDQVEAGDKIIVYMASSNASTDQLCFSYLGEEGTQLDQRDFTNVGTKYEFVAQYSGSYKIYTTTAGGAKPVYNRVVRIPGVSVTGTIDLNGASISDYSVIFTNQTTGVATEAVISGSTFSVTLAADEDYVATLSGATGYGFTNATKQVSTTVAEALTAKTGVQLQVESKSVYTYSGKLTGFAEDYDLSDLSVKLAAPEDSLADDVQLELGADLSYQATLEPDVAYTVELNGVNDYEVTQGATISDNQNLSQDIQVALKPVYQASGTFVDLPAGTKVSAISFTNEDDGYVYTGSVTADGYQVSLRDGAYAVDAVVDGYRTATHVVVSGADVTRDLLFVSTSEAGQLTWVPDLYVGYEEQGSLNYDTVKEAVAACEAMNPTSEEQRITVHIAPGTYREQIIISTPYISFVNDTQEEVLLTWYYGIGYSYYSADSSGYYNEENAYDAYQKATVSKWGCSTYLKSSATGFRAEGITFEASFNRCLTDEELADGVEVAGSTSITYVRKYGADVASKAATERSTALAIEADQTEFLNCSFLGSQDTLYTGNAATNSYFKDCKIEGNTDYIFGDGNCVFDGCELQWYGYSANSTGGYITAARPTLAQSGYLFRNCSITANEDLTVTAGYLGRPWGANASVTYLNTKLQSADLIVNAGWYDMSGNSPQNANYHEYHTTFMDGTVVDTSERVTGVMSQEDAAQISVASYLGDWIPSIYTQEDLTVAFTTAPYVIDNGDINAPYPGHTLTAVYSLGTANDDNDASLIEWYVVDSDGTETLVKSATAVTDRTYQITEDAIGKYIKVKVIPETYSGNQGNEATYQVEAFVRDGYEDPSGTSAGIELGDGVNIFLAGDSTVKDYSATGMNMSGKAQAEGSWGEFLQSFFDSSLVKIQDYANGGRSSRSFINEGSLESIQENLQEGDFLFIQFGHNDCANSSGYLEERYVPLGEPDSNGIYPTTEGTKVATPSSLTDKYGDEYYSYDCGGTYKWYLLQYIEVAKAAGATPVLVTPVSRMYYNADGTIKAHHDSTDTTTGTQVTANDAYVTAVKQLAEEQGVALIDGYSLTKTMYETAYANDPSAANGVSEYGTEVMAVGDKTHSNKLGGFLSAALFAQEIQNMDLSISSYVTMPSQIAGENPDGQQVFTVNGKNELSAYAKDADGNFTVSADYWTTYGQTLINEIGEQHEALNAEPTQDENATVWVIGDSTVCSFTDAYYYPRYGWGTQLYNYFDSTLTVNNLALSGRSSKSYVNDPEYTTLMDGMQNGDYLMIGFGHNDEKAEADRYTNPNGDYLTEGSFANSLYENYIVPAQAAGVTVILCTPIVRRTATGVWSDSNLHITADSGEYEGGDYAQSIRDLGTALNIPVIDMTTMTKNLYDAMGPEATLYLHAWTSSKDSSVDNTHTNIWGARYNAYMITQEIKSQNIAGISSHILSAEAPEKSDVLVSNPDYVEPDYSSELTDSTLWNKIGIWSGTVFGSVGGNPSTANQTLEEDADGNMHIAVANNKGKIASTADGIAMYYYKVPADATFTLSATATINSYVSNDQVSFGLMARDDMYIDSNITSTMGDYVAAGLLKLTQTGNVWNCFARKSGVLTQGGTCEHTYAANDSVALKIEGTSDGYSCTFGEEQTVSGGFDFKLTSIDSDYVYVGMYVARNADITFSDIKLIVNGEEVVADSGSTDPTGGETGGDVPDDSDEFKVVDQAQITAIGGQIFDMVVEAEDGVVPEGTTLESDILTEGTELEKAKQAVGDGDQFTAFNISLLSQGVSIEPDGTLRITVDLPDGYNGNMVKVYRLNEDGSLTDMNATVADGLVIFTTTHLSTYLIVDENSASGTAGDTTGGSTGSTTGDTSGSTTSNSDVSGNTDTTNTGDGTTVVADTDSVQTGDRNMMSLYALLLALTVGTVLSMKKRRKITKD